MHPALLPPPGTRVSRVQRHHRLPRTAGPGTEPDEPVRYYLLLPPAAGRRAPGYASDPLHASNAAGEYVRIPLLGELQPSGTDHPAIELPTAFALHPVYPNPFNATTTIRYDLPTASHVSLVVYDILGKQVAVLADGMHPAGRHTLSFDASSLSSGVYFCRLEAGSYSDLQKLVLVK